MRFIYNTKLAGKLKSYNAIFKFCKCLFNSYDYEWKTFKTPIMVNSSLYMCTQ